MVRNQKYGPHLPLPIAIVMIAIMVGVAFGEAWPRIKSIVNFLSKFEPWNASPDLASIIKVVSFLVTVSLVFKQMGYYYIRSGRKGGIFRESIWHLNHAEKNLDWLLGIWGALLFPIAVHLPTAWLFIFSVYCVLGWARCVVTLSRKKFAQAWERGKELHPYYVPWDTYPFEEVEALITDEAIENLDPAKRRLRLFAKSIDGIHKTTPTHPEVKIKHVLAGWAVSFKIHGMYSLVIFIINLVLLLTIGPTRMTLIIHSISIISVGILFWKLSKWSLIYGEKICDRYVEP